MVLNKKPQSHTQPKS